MVVLIYSCPERYAGLVQLVKGVADNERWFCWLRRLHFLLMNAVDDNSDGLVSYCHEDFKVKRGATIPLSHGILQNSVVSEKEPVLFRRFNCASFVMLDKYFCVGITINQ